MEKEFRIKAYGFGELAMMYFPNIKKESASTTLARWISADEFLTEEMEFAGWRKGLKILTPKIVDLIVKRFGEP